MTGIALGIGTDLVDVSRISAALSRHGYRFVQRIMSDRERQRYPLQGDPGEAPTVAKFFAAKEAVVKALGTGFRQGVSWSDIHVGRDELGAPTVLLEGAALARMRAAGGRQLLLSLSDESGWVLAFAVMV